MKCTNFATFESKGVNAMFKVNKDTKTIEEVKNISFKECGLKERNDLQEWIANNPNILGE